jgi:hypothetical protein
MKTSEKKMGKLHMVHLQAKPNKEEEKEETDRGGEWRGQP